MSSRLRSLSGPKTSFFAFQDIITSVTGVLILVTLLLASHLDQADSSASTPSDLERQLHDLLKAQTSLEVEAGRRAQAIADAEATPDAQKLRTEIVLLTARVENERRKTEQLRSDADRRKEETRLRDERLGLAELSRDVDKALAEAAALVQQAAKSRGEHDAAASELKNLETALLRVRARKGEVWVLPDNLNSTKEPILAIVSADGLTLERFDQPNSRHLFPATGAHDGLATALKEFTSINQYLVFYIRPSGVAMFEELSKKARAAGFEIGFDAIDEKMVIHFSRPPTVADLTKPPPLVPPAAAPASPLESSGGNGNSATAASASTKASQQSPTASAPEKSPTKLPTKPSTAPEPNLNWWQRLLRAIGLY